MYSTVSDELPVPVVTTICFAPTVLEAKGRTGVTKVILVVVTLEGVTSTPSILTVVAVPVGSKFVPDTVTVVPPAAVPEVGEIELIEGGTDACEIETNPPEIKRAEIKKATVRKGLGLVRACLAKTIPLSQKTQQVVFPVNASLHVRLRRFRQNIGQAEGFRTLGPNP